MRGCWRNALASSAESAYAAPVPHFHVTSSLNRASIAQHGLDWTRMGAAPGIAGSRAPEAEGVFVVGSLLDADWFVQMNNTGGPVDVWRVDGVPPHELTESGTGFLYVPRTVPASRVTLVRTDLPPQDDWP